MAKRRIPKGAKLQYAELAYKFGFTSKKPKELQKFWIAKEKRRTHKRERREGKSQTRESD